MPLQLKKRTDLHDLKLEASWKAHYPAPKVRNMTAKGASPKMTEMSSVWKNDDLLV